MTSKYALVIGNSQYDDPRLAQLSAPGKDAEDLARILRDRSFCAFDDVRVLLNQPEPVVRGAIDEFFDQKSPDDLLVLYFSGHGVRDELGALYLAVKNTNRAHLRSTAIKSNFIQEAMEQSRARRQVLILDCCNSGAVEQGAKAATGGSIGIGSAFGGYGRVILTASDSLQYAWQGDVIVGNTENSLFTHFLVEGLKGEAEVNADGCITVDALYDYTYEQVKRVTPRQTPSKFSTKQEGEIVLRQITQMEQIKAAPLPVPLAESMENPLAAVRLGAVQELARLLKGRNLGLARSAREALESLSVQDDSLSVRKAASDALAPILAAEQAARVEAAPVSSARAQVGAVGAAPAVADRDRLAAQQAEQERLAQQRAEQDRLRREKAEREKLAAAKAREEGAARRKVEQAAADAQPHIAPRWLSILWIALGFVLTTILGGIFSSSTAIAFTIDGALAGLAIAGVLYLEKTLRQRTSLLWITLAWTFPWVVRSGIYAAFGDTYVNYPVVARAIATFISMAMAGLALAYILRSEHVLSGRNAMLWVSLGWAVVSMIGAVAYQEIYQWIFEPAGISFFVPLVLSAAFHGASGSFITVLQIRTTGAVVAPDAAAAPDARQAAPGSSPRWLSVLWIALGFLIGSVLGQSITTDEVFSVAIYGALGGLTVALVLRLEHLVDEWKSILWVALGGAFAWAITGFVVESLLANGWSSEFVFGLVVVEAISGGVLGAVLALVLVGERSLSQRDFLLRIVLAWAGAAAVDSLAAQMLYFWIFEPAGASAMIPLAISAALDGAIGGLITVWLIRRANAETSAA